MPTTESQEALPSKFPPCYHLPTELWEWCFSYCLDDHNTLLALLRVSSQFYAIAHTLLYTHIYITHPNQIRSLTRHGVAVRQAMFPHPNTAANPAGNVNSPTLNSTLAPTLHAGLLQDLATPHDVIIPRTIETEPSHVVFPTEPGALFQDVQNLVALDLNDPTKGGRSYGDRLEAQGLPRKISLDLFRLRVDSYSRRGDMRSLALMFSYINTKRFIWTGCDPSHHFAIAIVPTAVLELFDGLSRSDGLAYLKLTHVSFAPESRGRRGAYLDPWWTAGANIPRLVPIPSLEEVVIAQATYVIPQMVVQFVMDPCMTRLRSVSLIEAYTGCTFGPQLKHSDLVAALEAMEATPGSTAGQSETFLQKLQRLEEIVKCEARTERTDSAVI